MRKIFQLLFIVSCCVMIMGATCSRVCTCGNYVGFFQIGEEYEENIPIKEKCSDLSTWDDELKMGTKCR